MRRAALMLALLAPSTARAYTLHTTVTNACHEPITLEALARTAPPVPADGVSDDEPYYRLAEHFGRALEVGPPAGDADALWRTSLVLGVRDPDLRGNGPADLIRLRWVHLPEVTQDDHFLRRSEHDGAAGVAGAAQEGRERLLALIEASAEAYAADPEGTRLVPVRAWIQYYHAVEVEVWEPFYRLGEALHLVQDSFTHTYRSDDLHTILEIQNYVESVGHDTYWREGRRDEVDAFLDAWMSLEPGCEGGMCTSRWVAIAQSDETGATGCAVRPGRPAGWLLALGLALALALVRRR